MRTLFGTDGIRGVAGEYPLDNATVFAIGKALGQCLRERPEGRRILLGMDTRESSTWIANELAAGLASENVAVVSAGVIPTPGVAYLTRTEGFSAGVVISASHNPWRDNGIKVFGSDGYKLPDATELAIEEVIHRVAAASASARIEHTAPLDSRLAGKYLAWLLSNVSELNLKGKRIVLDCANGAASQLAPALFTRLGATLVVTHADPNGRNINDHCGALHPEVVARETAARRGDIGITFDGDADRALFSTHDGRVVNGDGMMLLAANDYAARGLLAKSTVVATTMSNMGLEAALRGNSIAMLRAPVGDKYVLEEMRSTGAVLGGEQSGHILFLDRATTGDGLLTALLLLDIIARSGKPLETLLSGLETYPQTIQNVRVREKRPLTQIPGVQETIRAAELELGTRGRVVVRYSGTEKLARVMIEAADESAMRRHANAIAKAIAAELGE
jgi:phosphoglucosamine mutase